MNETEVKIIKKPSHKDQFGKSNYTNRLVESKWSGAIALSSLVTTVCLSVIYIQVPNKYGNLPGNEFVSIATAKGVHSLFDDIPNITSGDSPATRKESKRGTIVYYSGLQQSKRPRLEKIPPGSVTMATLLTGATDGIVRAKTTTPLEVAGDEVIPPGAILLGKGQSGKHRLFIGFQKLVFPDGNFISIQAQAADKSDKTAGLKGSKLNGYATRLAGAIALNFVSGYSEGLKQKAIQEATVVDEPTAKNALLNGASKASLEFSKHEFQKLKNHRPSFQVKAGTKILVIFGQN
jgi:hypothetical protein